MWLGEHADPDWFPPLEQALRDPPGLLAAGGDLNPVRLLAAYERGVFPWYSAQQPILWWSPDPRMVLFPNEFNVSRSLRKTLRNGPYTTRSITAFGATIRACAAPRRSGPETWLNNDMIEAYEKLFQLGFAHSIETYRGRLARRAACTAFTWAGVLRRIHVQPRTRRLQGRGGAFGPGMSGARHQTDRLPGGQRAPRKPGRA